MRKNFSILAALTLAVSFVCVPTVFTACSEQTNVPGEEKVVYTPGPTQYINVDVDHIIDNVVVFDGKQILFNGQTAMTAFVAPDSLVLTMPAADHKAAVITDFGTNRWSDSNGNGFTGNLKKYDLDGLTIEARIMPADAFSTLTTIHPKVSMVKGDFRLKGYAELSSGKRADFDLKVENGTYFLSDTSVEVHVIDSTKIEVKDSLVTEYVNIDKNLVIVNGFGYGLINFSYGEKSFEFHFELDSLNILREEAGWGVATKTAEDKNGFDLNDAQHGKYTVKENGISLKSVNFVGEGASFLPLNNVFKYGTAPVKVVVSYTDKNGEKQTRDFSVSGSYFHELIKAAQPEPEVIIPEVKTTHTYDVDSTHTAIYQDGKLIGVKVKFTIKRDGATLSKGQYMEWETGLATGTVTGTQVGGNQMLRATIAPFEEYHGDGWWGEEPFKGGTLTAYSLQFHFRTAFKAVPGFGQSEQSVAETNLIFCKRSFDFVDAENPEWEGVHWSVTGDLTVEITEDRVGNDEQAKAEVNSRGLQYEYIGTHYLSFDQYVGTTKVTSQSRAENLLYPKN